MNMCTRLFIQKNCLF